MCKSIAEGGRRCAGHLKVMKIGTLGPGDLKWMTEPENMPNAIIDSHGPSGAAALNLLLAAKRVEADITASVKASIPCGWGASELECRMKSPDSLARKIALVSVLEMVSPIEAATMIGDGLRYTIVSPTPDGFSVGVERSLHTVVNKGNKLEDIESSFESSSPYMGVHAHSKNEVKFEIQYHTTESLAAKYLAHPLFELVRDISASFEDRVRAYDQMASMCAHIKIPEGIGDIEVDGIHITRKEYQRPERPGGA